MPELEVDNWVERSRLTAHLPVSERPLHSDIQVVGEAKGRSQHFLLLGPYSMN